jgi:hypothetical protein
MDINTKRKAFSLCAGALALTALGGLVAGCTKKEEAPAKSQAQSQPVSKEQWAKEHGYSVSNGGH